jgi:hypothetical protein
MLCSLQLQGARTTVMRLNARIIGLFPFRPTFRTAGAQRFDCSRANVVAKLSHFSKLHLQIWGASIRSRNSVSRYERLVLALEINGERQAFANLCERLAQSLASLGSHWAVLGS